MKTSPRTAAIFVGLATALNAHAQVLSVDFNRRNSDPATNTMAGFSSFIIHSNLSVTAIQTQATTRVFGTISVTVSNSEPFGYDDRLRVGVNGGAPTNNAAFAESLLLRDFVFSRDLNTLGGLDVTVGGLTPAQAYRSIIWSYDNSSAGQRVSDWFANSVLARENYTFNGAVLPTNNLHYRFSVVALASGSGEILLQGRRKANSVDAAAVPVASFGVFLNALRLEETVPSPVVTAPPASAIRGLGDRVTFTHASEGVLPLTYQWLKGEVEIPGATSNSLTLSGLTLGDTGDFQVVVANSFGMSTSAVATLTVLDDPAPAVLQGLISHWPMESIDSGPSGPFTPDVASHNDMLLVNTNINAPMDFDTGAVGSALKFNGIDNFGYRLGGFPIYNNPAYTVALWVKGTGTGQSDRRFFSESATNLNNPLFNLGTDTAGANGTIRVFIRNDAGTVILARNSTRTALDGTWHHVVWTETNGQGKLYIDGSLDESNFTYVRAALTLNQTTAAAILRATAANYFAGSLDELAVWNRALTYTEIQSVVTQGIPPPPIVPPVVTQHPASQSVLTQSKVSFAFQATGTGPLFAQWRKDGGELVDETNLTYMIPQVVLGDAGNYDVVVTNAVGSITSQVAVLTVTLRPLPAEVLRVDFNNLGADDSPANTEAGFSSFSLPAFSASAVTRTFGGIDVTLTPIGTTMESRKRATPINGGSFTEERLLQDFIFARDATTAQGLDVALEFLEPGTPYRVSIWSYDSGSPGARISDWTANGVAARTGWTFDGAALPTANDTYRFNFDTTSDALGKILIQGRRAAGGGTFNVYINSFHVEKRRLRVTRIEQNTFTDIVLTIEIVNPSSTYTIVQKTSLTDAVWAPVDGVFFEGPVGNLLQATFPLPVPATGFFRVLENP